MKARYQMKDTITQYQFVDEMAKEQQKTQAKQQKARTRYEGAKDTSKTLSQKFKEQTAGLF